MSFDLDGLVASLIRNSITRWPGNPLGAIACIFGAGAAVEVLLVARQAQQMAGPELAGQRQIVELVGVEETVADRICADGTGRDGLSGRSCWPGIRHRSSTVDSPTFVGPFLDRVDAGVR